MGERELVSLGQALDIALVEELDLDVRVALLELAELPVLSCDEGLLHRRHLEVQVLLRQVEVGLEGLDDTAVRVLLEHERSRLVLPRDAVVIEDPGALDLDVVDEPRRLVAAKCLEIGCFQHATTG